MTNNIAPKVFHSKNNMMQHTNFVAYPLDLLSAINHKCTYHEQKILLVLLGCKGDGSFSPSIQYMLNVTGIKAPNHYFTSRKKLEDKGYLTISNKAIHVNIDKIMEE